MQKSSFVLLQSSLYLLRFVGKSPFGEKNSKMCSVVEIAMAQGHVDTGGNRNAKLFRKMKYW